MLKTKKSVKAASRRPALKSKRQAKTQINQKKIAVIKRVKKNKFAKLVPSAIKKSQLKKSEPVLISYPQLILPSQEPISSKIIPAQNSVHSGSGRSLIQRAPSRISKHVLDLKSKKENSHADVDFEQLFSQKISSNYIKPSKRAKHSFSLSKALSVFSLKPMLKELKPRKTAKPRKIIQAEPALKELGIPTPKKVETLGNMDLSPSRGKAILAFISCCLLIILPFYLYAYAQNLQHKKIDVVQKAMEAISHLATSQKAASAQDLYYTEQELKQSASDFDQAKQNLDNVNVLVKNIIDVIPQINDQYGSATKLLDAGEKLSSSAAKLTDALSNIKVNRSLDGLNLTSNISQLKDRLNQVLPDLQTANDDLQQIDLSVLPNQYQPKVKTLQSILPPVVKSLDNFASAADLLLNLLGQNSSKRYLIVFQNSAELRPTGGFIGSYALVDIDQGNIKKISVPGGGPYDLRAGLKANIIAPLPLQLMNPRWEFQDSNWFANVPSSGDKMEYLFEKSGGPTVDGIIFVNSSLFEQLLSILGPIDLPNYNLTLNQDNVTYQLQKNVEQDYNKETNKPKQIIADLTPIVLDKIIKSDREQYLQLLNLFLNSLADKDLQFYFTDYQSERFVTDHNWGGSLAQTSSDYLDVVSTNIAGEKTDAKIQQTGDLKVAVQADGSIINTLTITKTHTGLLGEPFYGVDNLDYLRVYVPSGSELLKAEGFDPIGNEFFLEPDATYQKDPEIAQIEDSRQIEPLSQTEIFSENDKTVFANWMKVSPGKTKTVTLQYRLPFKLQLPDASAAAPSVWQTVSKMMGQDSQDTDSQIYSLIWQKQSGKENFNIHASISLPQPLNYQFVYPDYIQKDSQTFSYTGSLDQDQVLAIIYKP